MIYEIMRYKSKFELLQLSDFSLYRTGVGIINSMGLQIIDIGT